eukprot:1142567-Lingulodinium_polyedra.AAC.1
MGLSPRRKLAGWIHDHGMWQHASRWQRPPLPVSMIDRGSWKLKRVCRSSLSAKCQTMAEPLDALNFIRFFRAIVIGRIDQGLELTNTPDAVLVTD